MPFPSSKTHHAIPCNLKQSLDKTSHKREVEITKEKLIPVFRVKGLYGNKEPNSDLTGF